MESTYLYGTSKTGKSLFWRIWMEPYEEGYQVITEYGEEGTPNPQQTKPTRFMTGKHIGKSNETTAKQQAEMYMKRKTLDKIEKQGYSPKKNSSSSIFYPMLANKITHSKLHKMDFPAYAQPKLDGVRCVAKMEQGKVALYSRTGKEYTGLWMIEAQLEKVFEKNEEIVAIDGELGCFPKDDGEPLLSFQEVCGYVKRKKKNAEDEEHMKIEYHIFDIVIGQEPWISRYQIMKTLQPVIEPCSQLSLVETRLVSNASLFLKYHQENIQRGFEGTMYRTPSGKYIEKHRSTHLLKYKDMTTEEYPIVGYVEGKGNDAGTVIWIVDVNGKQCKVRPKGTREYRSMMLSNASSYLGKMLTVQFQEFTNDGIPRFPVGLVVRDYE